jgi:hypothetical protein
MLRLFPIGALALWHVLLVPGTAAAAGIQRPSAVTPTPTKRGGVPVFAASALRLDGMTKEQAKSRLASLSDDALVEFKGRKMTKRQLLGEVDQNRRKALEALRAGPPRKPTGLEAKMSAAAAARQAKLQAKNSQASAQLSTALGKILPPCSSPKIAEVFLFSNVTPGGIVAVKGCGFGSTQSGKSFALELSQPPFPHITIKVTEWKDGLVSGILDPGVKKVYDQPAHFQITYANGVTNSPDVAFTAARETKLLPFSSLKVNCSTESDYDHCESCEQPAFTKKTIHGFHGTTFDPAGSDDGTDSYSVTLKPGWRFVDMTWDNWGDDGYASQGGFVKDSASLSLTVKWNTGCGVACNVSYTVSLLVEGPIGTAPK